MQPEGEGRYTWPDGSVYEGSWMSGQKHGWGKYSWPSGATYLGEWKNGALHGYGTFVQPDGSRYQGNWENSQKNGIGTKWCANGDRHEGVYLHDQPHGPGRFLFASGSEFDGEFREGRFHGQGTFKWISKHRYDGEWYEGMKHGIGVFSWPDGATYEGFWRDGMQHGVGVFRPSRKNNTSGGGTSGGGGINNNANNNDNTIAGNTGAVVHAVAATATATIAHAPAAAAAASAHFASAGAHLATAAYHHLADSGALFRHSEFVPPQPMPEPPHTAAASPPISRPGSPTTAAAAAAPSTLPNLTTSAAETFHQHTAAPKDNTKNVDSKSTAVYACEYRLGDLILEERLQPEDLDYVFGTATRSRKISGTAGGGLDGTVSGPYPSGIITADSKGGFSGGPGTGAWKLMGRQSLVRRRRRPKKEERMGETIYKGSPSFDLMLNLQLGIRYTLTTLSKLPPLAGALEKAHFDEKVWIRFPRQGSEVTPPHPSNDFKWKDYSPIVFRQLRGLFGISNSEYILSTCGDHALKELPSPGKSGSVFFVSQDERFIIKTMRKEEVKLLLRTLPLYYAHVAGHPDTLISRFYGIHRITLASGRKVRFVVMNNIFAADMPLHKKYDLKGSTYKRTATIGGGGNGASGSSESPGNGSSGGNVILKDLDLKEAFQLKKPVAERLQRQLAADAEFLQAADVMDYSLLLGVHYRGKHSDSHDVGSSGEANNKGDSAGLCLENSKNKKNTPAGAAPITIPGLSYPEESDNELLTPGSSIQSHSESRDSSPPAAAAAAAAGGGGVGPSGVGGNSGVNGTGDEISPLVIHNSMSFSAKMMKNRMQQVQPLQQQPLPQNQQQPQPATQQQPLPKLPKVGTGLYFHRFMAWRRDTKEKKRQKAEQASGLGKVALAPTPTPAPPPLPLPSLEPFTDGYTASGHEIPSSPSLSASSGAAGSAPFIGFHRRTTSATAALGSLGSQHSLFSSPAAFNLGMANSASTAPSSPMVNTQQRPESGPILGTNSAAARAGSGHPTMSTKNKNNNASNAAQHHLKVTYSDQLIEQHAALVASLANWGEKNKNNNNPHQQAVAAGQGASHPVGEENHSATHQNSAEDTTTPTKQQPSIVAPHTTPINDENTTENNKNINYRADAVAPPLDSSVVEPTTPSSARVSNVFTRNLSNIGGVMTSGEMFVTPFSMQTPPPPTQAVVDTNSSGNPTAAAAATAATIAASSSSPFGKLEKEATAATINPSMPMSYSEAFDGLSDDEAQAMVWRLTTRLSKPIEERLAFDLLRLARHKMLGATQSSRGGKDGNASSRLPTAVLAARHARFAQSTSLDRKGMDTSAALAAVAGVQQQPQSMELQLELAQSLSRHVPAIAVPLDPTPSVLSATTATPLGVGADGDKSDVALFLGVIDWLQPYNARKRLEHGFKSVVLDSRAISVCEPRAYAKRFLNLMARVFVPVADKT